MADRKWIIVNPDGKTEPTRMQEPVKLTAPPKTDIWRPSPTQDDFNARFMYTAVPAASFKSASITFSADWKTLYDQGGLMLAWPHPGTGQKSPRRWVKTGIEFFEGKPALSVVGCDRFSDWSLAPLPANTAHATLQVRRVDDTLWVYYVSEGQTQPLREIKWAFLDKDDVELWVALYAAKPTPENDDESKGLDVEFRDLQLEVDS